MLRSFPGLAGGAPELPRLSRGVLLRNLPGLAGGAPEPRTNLPLRFGGGGHMVWLLTFVGGPRPAPGPYTPTRARRPGPRSRDRKPGPGARVPWVGTALPPPLRSVSSPQHLLLTITIQSRDHIMRPTSSGESGFVRNLVLVSCADVSFHKAISTHT